MVRIFQPHVPPRRLLLVASEAALLLGGVYAGTTYPWGPMESGEILETVRSSAFVTLVLLGVIAAYDLYDWRVSSDRRDRNWRLFGACGTSLVVLALLVLVLQAIGLERALAFPGPYPGRLTNRLVLTIVAAFGVLASWRAAYHWAVARLRIHERLLVLGAGRIAQNLAREIGERRDTGFEVVGLVPIGADRGVRANPHPDPALPIVQGDVEHLFELSRALRVHRVVVALADRRGNLPVEPLLRCRVAGVPVEEWESLYEKVTGRLAVESLRPSYLIFSGGFRKSRFTLAAKRSMDVVLALLGLALTAPLQLFTAIAIRLDSPGPIFIRQPRIGKDGRPFVLHKFRSMRADAERETGPVWARIADERMTRVGRWLRKFRIDELPQMANVLRGDMSFVGPRPERPFFVEELSREIPYYPQRLTVKPGITGWAQINYPYGSSKEDAQRKLQYDLYYLKNLSLSFDLAILLRTVKVVLARKGAL